jgi:hypothetical protein
MIIFIFYILFSLWFIFKIHKNLDEINSRNEFYYAVGTIIFLPAVIIHLLIFKGE